MRRGAGRSGRSPEPDSVAAALELGAARLRAAGVPAPAFDAELLLRHVLGWDRAAVLVGSAAPLPAEPRARYEALLAERERRRPLQHLTGTQAFWRHEFLVTPDVLIPRPETELVVEAALGLLRLAPAPVIVDVGTGSGCIALCLAAELPGAEVHATEVSREALAVAEANAHRLGLAGRVHFHEGDLLEPLAALAGRLDLVASNPPYVGEDERETLAPEVRDHEPAPALFPPGDRYSIIRRLVPAAARLLRPAGHLVLEVGLGMSREAAALCRAAGLAVTAVKPDLQGIPRAIVARRQV
jgi:release factor glutamine methyltransferase